jgi:WD40 repeat protein
VIDKESTEMPTPSDYPLPESDDRGFDFADDGRQAAGEPVRIIGSTQGAERRNRRQISWLTMVGIPLVIGAVGLTFYLESETRRQEEAILQAFALPQEPVGDIQTVAFAPKSAAATLAAGGANGVIHLWNPDSGELLAELAGHNCGIRRIAFSPDGRLLASAAGEWPQEAGELFIWNTQSRQLVRKLWELSHPVTAVAFSPDGRWLAASRATIPAIEGRRQIVLWDTQDWRETAHLDENQEVAALAFSPDGQILAAGGSGRDVHLWHVPSRTIRYSWRGHQYGVRSLAFAPDGRTLVTAASGGGVRLWSAASGRLICRLPSPADCQVRAVSFSPDGKYLAVAAGIRRNPGQISLWNVATNQCVAAFIGHTDLISDLAFAPDCQTLATSGADCVVRLWSVAEHREIRALTAADELPPKAAPSAP